MFAYAYQTYHENNISNSKQRKLPFNVSYIYIEREREKGREIE